MYRNKKLKFYIKQITHTTDEAFYFRFTKAFKMVAGKKMEAQNIGKFIGLSAPARTTTTTKTTAAAAAETKPVK